MFAGIVHGVVVHITISLPSRSLILDDLIGNEVYIYRNNCLIHKSYVDNSQSGITFDVMAYRENDTLVSIEKK